MVTLILKTNGILQNNLRFEAQRAQRRKNNNRKAVLQRSGSRGEIKGVVATEAE
jgi:hypothetical protein